MSEQNMNDTWEQKAIKDVLLAHIQEQRRVRRWGIFFKFIFILAIIFFISMLASEGGVGDKTFKIGKPHIAKISVNGIIMDGEGASADNVITSMQEAVTNKEVKAIVLDINSPGGSPVQARMIFNEIGRLKETYPDLKFYAVINDIGTSAAYLIACGAHEIYADETSFVGSIGALAHGFGFVGAMEKLGVERRLYTSGKYKGMLDPFSPSKPEEIKFLQQSLDTVHQVFISNVKEGRGKKLKDNEDLFTGRFWTGKEAFTLGLIDGFADINKLSVDIIKIEDIVDYTKSEGLFEKISKKLPGKIKTIMLKVCNEYL